MGGCTGSKEESAKKEAEKAAAEMIAMMPRQARKTRTFTSEFEAQQRSLLKHTLDGYTLCVPQRLTCTGMGSAGGARGRKA